MHYLGCTRQQDVYEAIAARPGITKRQLMDQLGLSMKAVEMHLLRMSGEVHSRQLPGTIARGWHVGAPLDKPVPRVASVFELASAMGASA